MGDNLEQPCAVVGVRSPQAQVEDLHLLLHAPQERGLEYRDGGRKTVSEDLHRVQRDLRRLGSQDAGQGGAVTETVSIVVTLAYLSVCGNREADTTGEKTDV